MYTLYNDTNSISVARSILAEIYCSKTDTPIDCFVDYLICEMEWNCDGNEKIYDNQGAFRGKLFREWLAAMLGDNKKYLENTEDYVRGELGITEKEFK